MSSGSVNKAIIIGNLGRDPETRDAGGSTVCNISVATSERFKDRQGEQQERTEWHRVTLWGKLAELAGEYLRKGSKVYIEGKLQTRTYEKDGQTHYSTEIVAREMTFLGGREDRSQGSSQGQGYGGAPAKSSGYGGGGYGQTPKPAPAVPRADLGDPTTLDGEELPF